jgi:hypothetical protein
MNQFLPGPFVSHWGQFDILRKFALILRGARGKLIHEKSLKSKFSCQTPFNITYFLLPFFSGTADSGLQWPSVQSAWVV